MEPKFFRPLAKKNSRVATDDREQLEVEASDWEIVRLLPRWLSGTEAVAHHARGVTSPLPLGAQHLLYLLVATDCKAKSGVELSDSNAWPFLMRLDSKYLEQRIRRVSNDHVILRNDRSVSVIFAF
jgi:hypothetical protein